MSKYKNHIYLIICEVSLETFKKSVFLTYINYCRNMGSSLEKELLTTSQKKDMVKLIDMLDIIFTLNDEDTGKYIYDFFNMDLDKIYEFEKSVKLTQELFLS